MRQQYNILLIIITVFVMGVLHVSAQIVDEQGQYVDTTFHDNVDRTAENFVVASLLIADPGTYMYSVLGHACIRLQCSAFGLDYCYSYESESIKNRVFDFLAGNLKMGLFAIPIDEYCEQYRKEGRGVYEYKLNLPIEVKQELWRVMDKHLAEGICLPYDYYHRGCAATARDFVKEALGKTKIEYDRSLYENSYSVIEIWNRHTNNALWVRFLGYFINGGSEVEKLLEGEGKLLMPKDLVHAWQQAKVNGEQLLVREPVVLVDGEPQVVDGWFTPMVLAILLLILSIVNLFWNRVYFDWLMLVVQTLVGCGMIYMICFSDLCCTEWNWLIIPFSPLPIIFWRWRKYWALPYVSMLTVWCIAMIGLNLWWHPRMNWEHILLVVVWIFIMINQIYKIDNWKFIKI